MSEAAGWRAVATLYNALLTAMVVALVARRGAEPAREVVFQHFRRQHLEKFLAGLKKLGLDRLPHAVACALYHYHSNALGGVLTEYVRESDRKAWVRYPPPRWMWRGSAIAAIPHEVSAAMLHGWHGHNGVSLGNPRLGFVCTGMTVDGMPGLEGYYLEHDRVLVPEERVRFAYGEETMPRFDPATAPRLDATQWPAERLQRAHCRYATEYLRTLLPTLQALLGASDANAELGRVARLIGLQYHAELAAALGSPSNLSAGDRASAVHYARWLAAMQRAHGETVETLEDGTSICVRLAGWRLAGDVQLTDALGAFDAWNALWVGACAAHDRFLRLDTRRALRDGRWAIEWRVLPQAGGSR
ncbi:MAG: hypothetical protein AMJ64_02315 [Betaproteobacteria bacterium SG8_39]|nr:MAG: hypothetical protein AMJ64_02315 [Betaproteobacteria bacterium SG8_39]